MHHGILNKLVFYITLLSLIFFISYGIISTLGIAITLKYEVEEAHIAIDLNNNLSTLQKDANHGKISERQQQLKQMQTTYVIISAVTFSGTGILLLNRKRFLK